MIDNIKKHLVTIIMESNNKFSYYNEKDKYSYHYLALQDIEKHFQLTSIKTENFTSVFDAAYQYSLLDIILIFNLPSNDTNTFFIFIPEKINNEKEIFIMHLCQLLKGFNIYLFQQENENFKNINIDELNVKNKQLIFK